MIYEEVIIKDFIDAWFNKKYNKLPKDFFEICYNEYIDTTGLFISEEFDKVGYIHFLNNRIYCIKYMIALHKLYIENLDELLLEFIDCFEQYGYFFCGKTKDEFIIFLSEVEQGEIIQKTYLDAAMKELDSLRKEKKKDNRSEQEVRHSFLTMIHSLCKIGYKIDIEKNTVEDLALIVKKQMDEVSKYE